MESKPYGSQKVEVKSQPTTLCGALMDQLSNFRNNVVAIEIQGDQMSVIRASSKNYKVSIILKHSDGAFQGISSTDSRVKLKVLETENEYFSVSRKQGLKNENSRKRKWEKKSKS